MTAFVDVALVVHVVALAYAVCAWLRFEASAKS